MPKTEFCFVLVCKSIFNLSYSSYAVYFISIIAYYYYFLVVNSSIFKLLNYYFYSFAFISTLSHLFQLTIVIFTVENDKFWLGGIALYF